MTSKKRTRRQFSSEDKARYAAEAQRRREAGETWDQISEDLDVLVSSLKLWMKHHPLKRKPEPKPSSKRKAAAEKRPAPKLAEVTVVEPAADPAVADDPGLVLIAPSGHRISGLTPESAARLLEQLK